MEKPIILKTVELPAWTTADFRAIFQVFELPKAETEAVVFLGEHGPSIRGVALRKIRIDAAFLDALPELEIISS